MAKIKFNTKFQQFDVVFTDKGIMKDDCYVFTYNKDVFEPNDIFEDTLEYAGYHVTYSGKPRFDFKSKASGRTYVMFISDFDDILSNHLMQDNLVKGHFVFRKVSNQQGVRFVKM